MRLAPLSSFSVPRVVLLAMYSGMTFGCGPDLDELASDEDLLLSTEQPLAAPKIAGISVSGAGCPDPREFSISATRDNLNAELANYVVAVSRGALEAKSDCSVTVTVDAPADVAYSPAGLDMDISTDSRSEVSLSASGLWKNTSRTDAQSQTPVSTRGWRNTQTVLDEPELWSSCSGPRQLRISIELLVRTAQGRPGYASIHRLSNLRFRAKRCPPARPDSGTAIDGGAAMDGGTPQLADDGGIRPTPGSADAGADLQITKVTLHGQGCIPEHTMLVMSDDRKSFEFSPRRFIATNPEGQFAAKNCGLWVDVAAPPGYRTLLESFTVEGEMQLAAGATTSLIGGYWLSSRSSSAKETTLRFVGPRQGPLSAEIDFGPSGFDNDSCQPNLTVSLDIISSVPPGGPAVMVDIQRVHSWKFRLERCR